MKKLLILTVFSILIVSVSFAYADVDTDESQITIPYEFKNIAAMWYEDKITDDEFLQSIQIRINQEKIILPDVNVAVTGGAYVIIPGWIKNNAGWWAGGSIDDDSFAQGIKFLFTSNILPVDVDSELDVSLLPPKINYKHQSSNDEIRFSGFLGDLINCEAFSYVVPLSFPSTTKTPVVIEIIDPQGNVVGTTANGDDARNIKVDWSTNGKYLIHVHYNGDIYQEDFTHGMTSESFDSHVIGCLKNEHIKSVTESTWTWFNWPNHTQEGFDKNIKTAEEFTRKSNDSFWLSFVSAENINNVIQGESPIHDTSESFSKRNELKSILSDGIEQKVIGIFQDSENKLLKIENISLDQKTDLIYELRAERDQQVINQKAYAEEYVENLYRLYASVKASQDYREQYNELVNQINLQEKENELQIEKEKDAIRQEILSDNKISSSSNTETTTTTTESLCENSKTLIYKTRDNSTTCVSSTTAEKLVQRGWGYYP